MFTRGQSINARVSTISLYARWPIIKPRPTRANQDARVVMKPKWPETNSIDTTVRLAQTRTPPRKIVLFPYTLSRLIYPSLAMVPF